LLLTLILMQTPLKRCLALLASAFALGAGLDAAEPDAKITYKEIDSGDLQLHVFYPAEGKPDEARPAIVFFFGGGWVNGTPNQFYRQCEHLASRGMVAMAAEYRIKSKHGTSPKESVMDAKSAIRWVRSHAKELGIDPQRLAAGGGSAGGHLAAATATLPHLNQPGEDLSVSCLPDALVLFNPVIDNSPGTFGHNRFKDYWHDISPLHNIQPTAPPTIIFLGTEDELIPVSTVEKYQSEMEAQGLRCELRLYQGQPHGFFNKTKYQETLEETDRFLSSLGYLRENPAFLKN